MADSNSFLAERERRMAENKRRLEAMGLAEASAKLAASMPVSGVISQTSHVQLVST